MKLFATLFILSIMCQDSSSNIYDFKNNSDITGWYVVNDGVMGGLSKGTMSITDEGYGLFKGYVTTENNGGFSSVRYTFNKKDVSKFKYVVLKLKGDGKSYQFRIKENAAQRHSYITTFNTSGDWETIKIPLNSFYPSFRGYRLNKANFPGDFMEEVAFLIGNKVKESFALEIEEINLQ